MTCQDACTKHSHNPRSLVKSWARRIQSNQSVVWGAFGPTGSGKSEGNITLGIELQEILGSGPFDVRRQIAFQPKNRKTLAQALPKYRVILDDEATGEGGHRRRSMSTTNVNNVQDLDACRGRNQPNGFACPAMEDLDKDVVKHLLGYMEWHKDHTCEWFEAIRGGGQWSPWVQWESRFTVTKTPWLQELFPVVGQEYLAAKDDHMYGRRADAADTVVLEDQYYSIIKARRKGLRG